MKYFFLLSLSIILINFSQSSFGRAKEKSKNKNKKDGPMNWNSIGYDGILDGLLKNERKQTSLENTQIENNHNVNNYSTYGRLMSHIQTGSPAFISTSSKLISQSKSENQKSKTFRTVSPFEDSTKDTHGNKYSVMYRRNSSFRGHQLQSGYYGSSRLTR